MGIYSRSSKVSIDSTTVLRKVLGGRFLYCHFISGIGGRLVTFVVEMYVLTFVSGGLFIS